MPDDYTTPLTPDEQPGYASWAKAAGKNPADEEQDYDLPGLYKSGFQFDPNDPHAHGPDTFKKPNHPTFSDESQYHGVGGNQGGHWDQHSDGSYTFTAGQSNIDHWGAQGLQKYFSTYEPGNKLVIPDGY
jgi:hypothetical protein